MGRGNRHGEIVACRLIGLVPSIDVLSIFFWQYAAIQISEVEKQLNEQIPKGEPTLPFTAKNRYAPKMCGAFTRADKMCRIDAENSDNKCDSTKGTCVNSGTKAVGGSPTGVSEK